MFYTSRKRGPSYCSTNEKRERFTSSAKVVSKSWQIMIYGSGILCYSCKIPDDKFNHPAQRLYRSVRKVITFEFHLFRVYSTNRLTFLFVYGATYYTTDIHNTRYCFEITCIDNMYFERC